MMARHFQRRIHLIVLMNVLFACERHDVDVEAPITGRALSSTEQRELQRIADVTFRDVRALLPGLPAHLFPIER